MDEAKHVARALFENELTESSDGDSEPFDVERFLRTLAGQDTEQSRERRTGKQVVAGSLVALGVLRRMARNERIKQLLTEATASEREIEDEPTHKGSSGSRSVVGALLRLLTFAVVVAVVAYAVRKRGELGERSEPDATERDITETNVAEEDVMGTSTAEEDDVDEMVDTVEDEGGDVSPEPGETVVEEDVVEAATGEEAGAETEIEDAETVDETESDEEDESPLEAESEETDETDESEETDEMDEAEETDEAEESDETSDAEDEETVNESPGQ